MNCEEYRIAIHDYARGILSPEDVAQVEQHMHGCGNCVEFNELCAELSCREFVEFLSDYLEDDLAPERRAVFERHMTICPDCVNYLASYRRTLELGVQALSGEERAATQRIPEALVSAILAARSRTRGPEG